LTAKAPLARRSAVSLWLTVRDKLGFEAGPLIKA
jgi:hypothetical protein